MKTGQEFIKVTIPLPLWTDHVNCFLLPGEDGWRIVDTGIYTLKTMEIWKTTFQEHKISPGDVRQILLTHNHIDHLGAAGALQELTGAPVYMSGPDRAAFQEIWDQETMRSASPHRYFGMPEELQQQIEKQRIEQFFHWAYSCPEVEELKEGELIQSGDYYFQVLAFPGHSDGHLCLFNEQTGLLLGGDVFVAPNNLIMKCQNPLAMFFQSLQALQSIEISRLYPSHGKPFSRVSVRLGLIEQYRKDQLQRIKQELSRERTIYELYTFFLGKGAIAEAFFGMAELYFFLGYLLAERQVTKTTRQGAWYYEVAGERML